MIVARPHSIELAKTSWARVSSYSACNPNTAMTNCSSARKQAQLEDTCDRTEAESIEPDCTLQVLRLLTVISDLVQGKYVRIAA